jgi:hypothetical protein
MIIRKATWIVLFFALAIVVCLSARAQGPQPVRKLIYSLEAGEGFKESWFADGKKYPFPLNIVTFPDNGQTMIKWVALANKKDIVVYKRAI